MQSAGIEVDVHASSSRIVSPSKTMIIIVTVLEVASASAPVDFSTTVLISYVLVLYFLSLIYTLPPTVFLTEVISLVRPAFLSPTITSQRVAAYERFSSSLTTTGVRDSLTTIALARFFLDLTLINLSSS